MSELVLTTRGARDENCRLHTDLCLYSHTYSENTHVHGPWCNQKVQKVGVQALPGNTQSSSFGNPKASTKTSPQRVPTLQGWVRGEVSDYFLPALGQHFQGSWV